MINLIDKPELIGRELISRELISRTGRLLAKLVGKLPEAGTDTTGLIPDEIWD